MHSYEVIFRVEIQKRRCSEYWPWRQNGAFIYTPEVLIDHALSDTTRCSYLLINPYDRLP